MQKVEDVGPKIIGNGQKLAVLKGYWILWAQPLISFVWLCLSCVMWCELNSTKQPIHPYFHHHHFLSHHRFSFFFINHISNLTFTIQNISIIHIFPRLISFFIIPKYYFLSCFFLYDLVQSLLVTKFYLNNAIVWLTGHSNHLNHFNNYLKVNLIIICLFDTYFFFY